MSKPKKPRTYHALSCSFADLFHSAEAWQLEKTLRLVRLRLVATESHESTGQTTLATVPNEVFELVVDNVRENSVRPANLERLVKAYSRYEQTINPEAVDYDAFYEWLSCQTRSDTDSECSCLAPLDSCRKCDTRYTWQEPSDHEVYGDAFRESEDYRALLDVANEMSFENCFWTSDRWYGDRKKFEVWEDSREDVNSASSEISAVCSLIDSVHR